MLKEVAQGIFIDEEKMLQSYLVCNIGYIGNNKQKVYFKDISSLEICFNEVAYLIINSIHNQYQFVFSYTFTSIDHLFSFIKQNLKDYFILYDFDNFYPNKYRSDLANIRIYIEHQLGLNQDGQFVYLKDIKDLKIVEKNQTLDFKGNFINNTYIDITLNNGYKFISNEKFRFKEDALKKLKFIFGDYLTSILVE